MQRLMPDSVCSVPERPLQQMFSKSWIFSSLALIASVFALAVWSRAQPSRVPMADATVVGLAAPIPTDSSAIRMWRLYAPDRRFGGLSALVTDDGELLGLTDSGVVVRFEPPATRGRHVEFRLHDLPDGPGSEARKRGRDSEALLADPAGRGWWVAFENEHSLWRYDERFERVLEVERLDRDWPSNRGAEALVATSGGRVRALPEGGNDVVPAGTSDATRLADGRLALLVRRFGWRGFVNEVRIAGGVGRAPLTLTLPLGPLDNAEAITAASLPDGGTRLWIMTDDNFRPWMRTLLVALDMPAGA